MCDCEYKIKNLEKKVNELQEMLNLCLQILNLDSGLCDGCNKFLEVSNVKEKYENDISKSSMLENYNIVYACEECEEKYIS